MVSLHGVCFIGTGCFCSNGGIVHVGMELKKERNITEWHVAHYYHVDHVNKIRNLVLCSLVCQIEVSVSYETVDSRSVFRDSFKYDIPDSMTF